MTWKDSNREYQYTLVWESSFGFITGSARVLACRIAHRLPTRIVITRPPHNCISPPTIRMHRARMSFKSKFNHRYWTFPRCTRMGGRVGDCPSVLFDICSTLFYLTQHRAVPIVFLLLFFFTIPLIITASLVYCNCIK